MIRLLGWLSDCILGGNSNQSVKDAHAQELVESYEDAYLEKVRLKNRELWIAKFVPPGGEIPPDKWRRKEPESYP